MREWFEEITIHQSGMVKFHLDTGARYSVLSPQTLHHLEIKAEFITPAEQLKSHSGHMIDVGGVTTLPSKYKGKLYQLKFYMVDRKAPAI